MKLLFVRHGDPDYEHDTLTSRGWTETKALVKRFEHMEVKEFFVSPLGRARDTASCTLNALNRTAQVCDWLQEFPSSVKLDGHPDLQYAYPDKVQREDGLYAKVTWDILPGYWACQSECLHPVNWRNSEIAKAGDLLSVYDSVISQFDAFLSRHGYVRQGNYYKVEKSNRDTLVFFCHYGVTCVLLSHLMNVSPFILWHGTVLAPTSVTTFCTEEREQGIAYFRGTQLGDISHLWAAGIEPSFSARFCETYDSWEERH